MALDVQFKTGLLWQDTQHKEWIKLLDKLKGAKKKKQDHQLFASTISFLVMYANHHIGIENEYMKRYEYPERNFHMEEHRLFILRLKDFREKYRNFSDEATLKIIESMTEWVYSHILENDQKLGEFIIKKEQPHRLAVK